MTGCISTEPRHMYQRNTNSHKDKAQISKNETDKITKYS